MFRTLDNDLIGVPGMFGEGVSHWRGVSRLLRTPWYHLTLSVENEGRLSECAVMIDDTHQLQKMLVSQGADLAITEIMAVTPSWMNKSGGWWAPATQILASTPYWRFTEKLHRRPCTSR